MIHGGASPLTHEQLISLMSVEFRVSLVNTHRHALSERPLPTP